MRVIDAAHAAALAGSYTLRVFADVWHGGDLLYEGLDVVGGAVEFDADADVQASLALRVAAPDGLLVPRAYSDPLAPYGQEVHLSMAADGGTGENEPVSIGWFRIDSCKIRERWRLIDEGGASERWVSGGAVVSLVCPDRLAIVRDAKFLAPSQPAAGATVFGEIPRLTEDLVPIGDIAATLVDAAVPASVVYEEDRLASMHALARLVGGAIVMTSDGALGVVEPAVAGATPVHTFRVGPDGDILDIDREVTREGIPNAVVARGEATSDHAPVQGVAYDLDPDSPVQWGGPFGQVPEFYTSPLITTSAQARKAARTRLNNRRRGRSEQITVPVVPNLAVELLDPVDLDMPDRVFSGQVVRMTLPLTPGPGLVTVRGLDTSLTVEE